MKKITITIAIPAFNEEKNIGKLLNSLLSQKVKIGIIKQILVVSDKSTDRTENMVEKIAEHYPLVSLIRGKTRRGKPQRLNEIFKICNTDIVVILDADIIIRSNLLIEKLVVPFLADRKIGLVSGLAMHLPPKTYFEKVMAIGLSVWEDAKRNAAAAEMYTCEGQVRAVSKKHYKKIKFPQMSADDVYPYLYAKKHNIGYKFVPEAKIYFHLPSTLGDYTKQHTRYLHSKRIQKKSFESKFVENLYTISLTQKISSTIKYLRINPIEMSIYSLILILPKVLVSLGNFGMNPTWSVINSTKK